MTKKSIAVRLHEKQREKLFLLVSQTGWNMSDVIRRLIDEAEIHPAKMKVHISEQDEDGLECPTL